MIPKAPNVKYEVFLTSFGYTCGATDTLEKAIKIAKKTGFQCQIFLADKPFDIIKTVPYWWSSLMNNIVLILVIIACIMIVGYIEDSCTTEGLMKGCMD